MQSQSIIDIKLNTGNAISDAHALEDAFKSVGKAMDQAVLAGDSNAAKNYGQLQGMMRDQYRKMMDEQNPGAAQDRTSNSLGRGIRGINQFIGGAGNAIGAAGSGNAAGAVLGMASNGAQLVENLLGRVSSVGLAAAGFATALVGLVAGANKLSEQWEKVMQPSMALTASLGRLSDNAEKNSWAFQETFVQATARNVLHGYTKEEGVALANQLAKMGASDVFGGEEQVFRYQRDTDADRNTMAQAVGLAQRYRGDENVLGYAFGGLEQSGMKPGQYQEYLNATLRIFEEGLSRGVVKGFGEITRTQNMLAQIGQTWKGEQGAEKYQRMNDAIAGASALEVDYDTIMYKAAMNLAKDPGNYIEVSKILDKGLDTEILEQIHQIVQQATKGDDTSVIIQYKEMFGLNTTSANELLDFLKIGDWSKAIAKIEAPASKGAESTETKLLGATQQIARDVALIGSNFTPAKADALDLVAGVSNLAAGDRSYESYVEAMNRIENPLQNLEMLENEERDRYAYDILVNKIPDHSSPEYDEFSNIITRGYPELTFEKMKEIMEPAMRRDSEDMGHISKNELRGIINAIWELIPALRENTTTTVELMN
jgi:hypothetical protein